MVDLKKDEVSKDSNWSEMIIDVHVKPKSKAKWVLLSFQHVFAMFGATVLVPIVINQAAGAMVISISMALFISGVGTLIYIALTSAKVPIYLGSSFAYMTVIGMGWPDWGNAVFIAIFTVGIVYIIFGFLLFWTGTKWLNKVFSPVVVGPIIMIIGLSAIPSALQNIGIMDSSNLKNDIVNWPRWLAILVGAFTFIVAAIFILKAKSFLKVIPILMALIVGYVFVTILQLALIKTNYNLMETSLISDWRHWSWYPWDNPNYSPFWNVNVNKIGPALVSIVPISLVTMVEHMGDHINIGTITNRNYLKNPGIHRTLIADGVAMSLGGLLGGPPNATYAENTGVVSITKVASVWVTGLAAIFAIIMSFIAPINQLIMMTPKPVMGGISLILFGMISSNGVRIMVDAKIDFKNMKNILIMSVILGIGIGMGVTGSEIKIGDFKITGLFLATFIGVFANLFLPNQINNGMFKFNFKRKEKEQPKK